MMISLPVPEDARCRLEILRAVLRTDVARVGILPGEPTTSDIARLAMTHALGESSSDYFHAQTRYLTDTWNLRIRREVLDALHSHVALALPKISRRKAAGYALAVGLRHLEHALCPALEELREWIGQSRRYGGESGAVTELVLDPGCWLALLADHALVPLCVLELDSGGAKVVPPALCASIEKPITQGSSRSIE